MVGGRVVLGEVVGQVECARAPIETEEISKHPVSKPVKMHVHQFQLLGENSFVDYPIGRQRYPALLWAARIIWLAEYVIIASSREAA